MPSPLASDAHHRCAAKLLLLGPEINPKGWVSGWEGGPGPVALSRAPPPRLFPPPRPPLPHPADHPWAPRMQGCRASMGSCRGAHAPTPQGLRPGPPPPPCPAAPLHTRGRPPAASACAAMAKLAAAGPRPRAPRVRPPSLSPASLFLLLLLLSAPPGPARSAPPGAAPPGTGASVRDGGLERVSEGRSETQRGA